MSDTGAPGPFASETSRHTSTNGKDDDAKSARLSDAGSARLDTASQADSQSQEGVNAALSARKLAGIKQSSASNAKRTYGLQRSFLADQAEENLLSDPAAASSPSGPSSRNIEDEIEAELKGNSNGNGKGTAASKLSGTTFKASIRKPDLAPSAPRESYAELLKKWGEGAEDIEWDESQDPTLNLKSITSLRSQGELRRFNDDLEYLFTGLDAAQALSIRRSSTVELIRLLCGKPDLGGLDQDASDAEDDLEDPLASAQSAEFMRKLKASDLIARLFDLFRGAEAGEGVDDVLDAAIAVYIAKLLKSGSTAVPLTRERWSELSAVLHGLLTRADRAEHQERKDGLALLRLHELKLHKIASRTDRKTLAELRDIARISKLFVAGSQSWTLRNLVLASCCSLIVLPRRLLTDVVISDLFMDADGPHDRPQASFFNTVLGVLVSEGAKARHRLIDFTKGLELVTPAAIESIPDLETVDVCIRFLDKGMDVLYLELDQAVPASIETLESVQHLIHFAIQAAPFGGGLHPGDADKSKDNGAPSRALQILHGLFKMLLDLSQVDANWSESLASSLDVQEAVMRAFLLSHRSASLLRQTASNATETKSRKGKSAVKENDGDDATHRPGIALFEDVVHLSLALLTNLLIKQLDKARDTLQAIRINPACWGRRTCSVKCTCDDRSSALQLLARVFFDTRIAAASNDDSNAAYLSNSIATAIAQFAVGDSTRLETCRAALDAELPVLNGKSGATNVIKDSGFETLLDAVEEFAVVHEAALHAERARAAEAALNDDEDAEMQAENGDETAKATKDVNVEGDTSNPVAVEAGQLIKDLAIALRQMA
uniref:Wings apart-like protein C-terminal domain-containing protein n=2 Tax=Kalmanozyma brasiliensis (strain GHG001) TaxID=1365824 RepID=V5F1C0_KALBG